MLRLVATLLALQAPDSTLVRQFSAVLAAAPIERLKGRVPRTVVRGAVVGDVVGDGQHVALVWIAPELQQTPTLLLFTQSSPGVWVRLLEGLAPGHVRARSYEHQDTHELRIAVDMGPQDGSRRGIRDMLSFSAKTPASLVAYPHFLHTDFREGAKFVLDLSRWRIPDSASTTCEGIEFPRIDQVAVGPLSRESATLYVVALTEGDVTVYRISRIEASGRLVVSSAVRPRPPGVLRLGHAAGRPVVLLTANAEMPIAAP